MFAVSVNEENSVLSATLVSLEPVHMSVDNENGLFETAKLFPHLNILIDDDDEADRGLYQHLIVDKFLNRSKPTLDTIVDEANSILDDRRSSVSLTNESV